MPEEIQPNSGLYGRGNKRKIRSSSLNGDKSLTGGQETTIWSEQVNQDKIAWFGHGPNLREYAEAFVYADLVDDAGNPVDGELVLAITDSDQRRVLADVTFDDLGELADAADDRRTDRPIMDAMEPFARPGRHLELRVRADESSDGVTVDPAASDVRLYYSEESV